MDHRSKCYDPWVIIDPQKEMSGKIDDDLSQVGYPMKRITFIAVLLATALAGCGPPANETVLPPAESATPTPHHIPSDADRTAILTVVQSLFNALAERDGETLRALLHHDVVMRSVEVGSDGQRSISTSTVDDLVARVEGSEEVLTERMFDPEVRISGELAMVWTPYDFYVGETLSHCGADVFVLTRADAAWRVTGLSWTRQQPPDCELHPDGPPA